MQLHRKARATAQPGPPIGAGVQKPASASRASAASAYQDAGHMRFPLHDKHNPIGSRWQVVRESNAIGKRTYADAAFHRLCLDADAFCRPPV